MVVPSRRLFFRQPSPEFHGTRSAPGFHSAKKSIAAAVRFELWFLPDGARTPFADRPARSPGQAPPAPVRVAARHPACRSNRARKAHDLFPRVTSIADITYNRTNLHTLDSR